jgi:hypothetical protein
MKTLNSNRKFRIAGFESGLGFSATYYLHELLSETNDTELCYSIQDDIDKILDLLEDQFYEMYCNRDVKTAANRIIVWRIQ